MAAFDWNLFNGILLLWLVFLIGRQRLILLHQRKLIEEVGSMLARTMAVLDIPYGEHQSLMAMMESIPRGDYPKEPDQDEWKKWEES